MLPRKKKIIFGGSFDPIHNGHIILANYLAINGLQGAPVDEVILMVSPQNPLKSGSLITPDEVRLEMARAACAGLKGVTVSDYEFSLPKPSYTAQTLEALAAADPDIDYYLLVGSDNWLNFDLWKNPEKILSLSRLIIYPRPGYDIDPSFYPLSVPETMHDRVIFLQGTPVTEISSSFIRKMLSEGHDLRGFIPESVQEIIRRKRIYNLSEQNI